jgi:RNA polymerase sigma factor (TIGR02999 family)
MNGKVATPANYFPLVYDELKRLATNRLANEQANHSLDATALVHEAYLRLGEAAFADRSSFFRATAVAMQRILVDHARSKRAAKRGGGISSAAFSEFEGTEDVALDLLLDVDAALTRLESEDSSVAEVARCRLFAGLSIDDVAQTMGISRATAFREWAYARSWLAIALQSARK